MAAPEETQTLVCYRHPGTETAVTCSSCGRPICTECMVFAAVGIKCPECAGQPTPTRRATTRARTVAGEGGGYIVTKALLAVNALVFLVQISQSPDPLSAGGELFERGALFGFFVAEGEWWRLVTSSFLHVGVIHLLFNMLMLWWFGRPLELLLGRGRFVAIYGIAVLAGAAGALLLRPDVPTVGASGAVFGILGAGLVLERNRIDVFGGIALLVVAFNLAFSLIVANVSIGGHIGGLVGGALAMLALMRFGRGHAVYGRVGALEVAALAALAIGSVAVALAAVA